MSGLISVADLHAAVRRDYSLVTAKGQVPLLMLDDGARLGEGPLVLQHIAASMARYRVMQGLNLITRGQAGFLGLSQRLAA